MTSVLAPAPHFTLAPPPLDPPGRSSTRRLLALLVAAAALGAGCSRSSSASSPPAETGSKPPQDSSAPLAVSLAEVREIKVPRVLTLSGSLTAAEEAQVAAGAAGKVLATYIERGSVVKKGAVLARLDSRAIGAQASEAAAQVESMRAQQSQADLDCTRNEQLYAKGAISKAEYARGKTTCQTSKWSVSAAEARKALTAQSLRDATIRAPFSGTVVERAVTAGEYVRPDSRVVTLVNVDSLRVELTVPEADVAQVRPGMDVELRTSAPGSKPVHGRVRFIAPSVRKQTRDAVVEAEVANTGHDLRPGMFVTATLALGEQTLPAVLQSAVRSEGTLHHVFLAPSGRLEDRLVQVAEPRAGMVPIVSGLKAGERVVIDVTPEMRDGARVK